MSWNVHGNLALKMRAAPFLSLLVRFDIILLQETHLRPAQTPQLPVPRGFQCFALARPESASFRHTAGGVLALVRLGLPVKDITPSGQTDYIILRVADLVIVNAYLPPPSSPCLAGAAMTIEQRLHEVLLPYTLPEHPRLLVIGDLNARVGTFATPGMQRVSLDQTVSSRGRHLLRSCEELGLQLLNGSSVHDTASRLAFTSIQPAGSSVIDLVLATHALTTCTTPGCSEAAMSLQVLPHDSDWSDHSALALIMHYHNIMNEPTPPTKQSNKRAAGTPRIPANPTPLDLLLEDTLQLVDGHTAQLRLFYGPPWTAGPPLLAYLGAEKDTGDAGVAAGASVFWGPNAATNWRQRLTGEQTTPRACLLAALHAVRSADPVRTLRLSAPEDHLARTICHWAPTLARKHWVCAHADLIRPLVSLIKARPAPVRFFVYARQSANAHAAAAMEAARSAAEEDAPKVTAPAPFLPLFTWLPAPPAGSPEYLAGDLKVSTPLPPIAARAEKVVRADGIADRDDLLQDARWEDPGHQPLPVLSLRHENLRYLANSPPGGFWPAFRNLTGDKPTTPQVTIMQLFEVFSRRMNPPPLLSPHFDPLAHALSRLTAQSLPARTTDTTPGSHFSRPFTEEEVDEVKAHIRSHNRSSAKGADGIGYDEVLAIPSTRLRELFQACVDAGSAPQSWLTAIIAAVKKPNKDGALPESYRTIGLESCLLKTLTLLIDRRLRAWAEEAGRIPDTQSGFRRGHRTFNNAFILRAAIEKARALGKSLYVIFLDLANAFPSVDQATLWTKLARWGVAGPLADWLRMLYSHLQYLVRFGGETTECFKALMGILIGDPASPILWIIYLSDFDLRPHQDDVILGDGQRVSHIEIADDMAFMSLSPDGAQDKLDQTEDYCAVSCLLVNIPKTLVNVHGPLPEPLPPLILYKEPLRYVDTATYVGMTISSSAYDIFLPHYTAKEQAARRVAGVCFSLESYIGPLPPLMALRLYRSHIDPHLTGGCEVVIDVRPSSLDGLESLQHTFLRRALHISSHSQLAPLFAETGIWPLRYRRLELTLRYLLYLLTARPTLAFAALCESWRLGSAPHSSPSWWSDLHLAASMLPVPLDIPLREWPTVESVTAHIAAIPDLVAQHLRDSLLASQRLPVLQTRLRYDAPTDARPFDAICALRAYLHLPLHRQRAAITLLLFSEHPLAVEQQRRGPARRERHLRTCRWCTEPWAIEDEVHVLLECEAEPLCAMRDSFLALVTDVDPTLRAAHFRLSSPAFLDMLLRGKTTMPLLATYVADVFELCNPLPQNSNDRRVPAPAAAATTV